MVAALATGKNGQGEILDKKTKAKNFKKGRHAMKAKIKLKAYED